MANFISCNPKAADISDTSIMQLRVLFLSDAITGRNGVGSYYDDLIGHLKDYIAYAGLVSPGGDAGDYAHGLFFPLPGDPTQRVYLPRVSRIYHNSKTIAPDVIVVPTPGLYGLLGFAIAKYLGIPLCAGYHTRYEKLTELYWNSSFCGISRLYMKLINRILFRSSERVVANSMEMIDEARRDGAPSTVMAGTPIGKTFLTPPFAPLSADFESVCYAGRLALEKNIEDILRAAERLSHIRFTIAGDGPLRDKVAEHAKTFPNVEYAGWLSREGVKDLIDESDMLLLPSEVEAFGTIALEAMARRRLVLVSEKCGILDWPDLADGVYAFGRRETLADAISRIAATGYDKRLKKANTAHRAAETFNNQTIRQWIYLFGDILAKGCNPEKNEEKSL